MGDKSIKELQILCDQMDSNVMIAYDRKQKYLNEIAKIISEFHIDDIFEKKKVLRNRKNYKIIGVYARSSKLITANTLLSLPDSSIMYQMEISSENTQYKTRDTISQTKLKEEMSLSYRGSDQWNTEKN